MDEDYKKILKIGNRNISAKDPTYFIADIGANHDGDLERAKELIHLAKEAGADCAKFQHFKAKKIVSDYGFKNLKNVNTHQSSWKKSVFQIYDDYHTKEDWSSELIETCASVGIDFMTTPYDIDAVLAFNDFVPAFKIGSGDITFAPLIEKIAQTNKTVFLATGASSFEEVERAVTLILKYNPYLCLMQCNTNYSGSPQNFNYLNLNVLRNFKQKWPDLILGLSDHTSGFSSVLASIALGAKVIEKHFTDDNSRVGPDHKFAMNPRDWREMVKASKEVELSLGDGVKKVEENEKNTVIVQRRAIRSIVELKKGRMIKESDVEFLRPCPADALTPFDLEKVIGKKISRTIPKGDYLKWDDLN